MARRSYPFWMYGDGWYRTEAGHMRFSYTKWLIDKVKKWRLFK